jgi:DNA polymerase phi
VDAAEKMFPAAPKKTKKGRKSDVTQSAQTVDADSPAPLDILIDVIIGFLEESTAFMRNVANQVFTLLALAVDKPESLDLILTVWTPLAGSLIQLIPLSNLNGVILGKLMKQCRWMM